MGNTRVKIQQYGSKLSSMVIPNLGAFIAWGLLTAIAVPTEIELFQNFILPMLKYLLPILIAFSGGRLVYDYRGGVVGSVAAMGVIVVTDIPMFIGAMIMGPLGGWTIKKFDELIEGKVKTGFELLVNNFSAGIIGAILALIGSIAIGPFISGLTGVLASGVNFMVERKLLPLTSIFIEPAKVLFLNNAIGQGILSPIASTQILEKGKSMLYLLESNPGPGLGILLAFMIFGKGNSKASAYGASIIHFIGGIHEIYFPYILMKPILLISVILGGMTGVFILTIFDAGLVSVASPGSIISIMLMTATGDHLAVLLSIAGATAVSFATSIPFFKNEKVDDESLRKAAQQMESIKGKKSRISSVFESKDNIDSIDFSKVTKIAYACDAGLGSSAMGATILQKKIKEAGRDDIEVFHIAINELPTEADIIVTHESLIDRVVERQPNAYHIAITDFLNSPKYDELAKKLSLGDEK